MPVLGYLDIEDTGMADKDSWHGKISRPIKALRAISD
jgi:hypothetical protein